MICKKTIYYFNYQSHVKAKNMDLAVVGRTKCNNIKKKKIMIFHRLISDNY
jgi:hypothetical protein